MRVGIAAPADVRVYRKELYATIQENQSAAQHAPISEAMKGLLKKL